MLNHCSNPDCSVQFAAAMTECPACGHVAGDQVTHRPVEIEAPNESPLDSLDAIGNTSLPVSHYCPKCGDSESFATSTGATFTVRHSRQCFACGTIYFQPTGRVVSVLLIGVGLLLTVGGAYACVDLA